MSLTLTLTASRLVAAPPPVVWRVFSGMLGMPPEGPAPAAVSLKPLGFPVRIRARITAWRPERQLAWEGGWLGIRLLRAFSLEPEAGGTRVTSREGLGGWAALAMRPWFSPRRLGRANQEWLAQLASLCEGRRRVV